MGVDLELAKVPCDYLELELGSILLANAMMYEIKRISY